MKKHRMISLLLSLVLVLGLLLIPAYAVEDTDSSSDTGTSVITDLLDKAKDTLTGTDSSAALKEALDKALSDVDPKNLNPDQELKDAAKTAADKAIADQKDLSEEDAAKIKEAVDKAIDDVEIPENTSAEDAMKAIKEAVSKAVDEATVQPSETPAPSESPKPSEEPAEENCPSEKFRDVDRSQWYHAGIDYALDKSYMVGTSKDTFEPYSPVTRAQVVQILYAREGKPVVLSTSSFSDVAKKSWYEDAVKWASTNRIVAGYPDGTFRPDASVTREELATMLYAYTKYKGYNTSAYGNLSSFPDGSSVSGYAVTPMRWAVGHNMLAGTEKGLEPQGTATRAQIATILKAYDYNVAGTKPVEEDTDKTDDNTDKTDDTKQDEKTDESEKSGSDDSGSGEGVTDPVESATPTESATPSGSETPAESTTTTTDGESAA